MKILNKITLVLAFVCTLFIMNPMNVEAATGRIMFGDPTVEAGQEFDIAVKVVSYDGTMDDISIELKYDSSKIEFLSGTDSIGGDGVITITATATGSENIYTLNLRALKKGNTSITISNQTIKTEGGDTFLIQEGNSAISVEGGTEVEATVSDEEQFSEESSAEVPSQESLQGDDSVIQVAGVIYEMSQEYLESEIPAGYSKENMQIRGENISGVKGDTSGVTLIYLINTEETVVSSEYGYTPKGKFFRYEEETGKFSPYVQIIVSDSTYIVFLTEDYEVELPIEYVPTTMTADGFDFPVWQDTELEGYYLVYAINSNGVKGLYRYDVNDQSYQRFVVPVEPENPNKVSNEYLQIIIDGIANNLIIVLMVIALLLFVFLVLTITFGIKLRNRNREIDDIYEEGVTAYNDSSYGEMGEDNEPEENYEYDDFDEEWGDNFVQEYSNVVRENSGGMLDDGLTQEFEIAMGNEIFKNEGFIDSSKQQVNRRITQERHNIDQYGTDISRSFEQSNTNASIGSYSKYQIDDDDDIEFIEI